MILSVVRSSADLQVYPGVLNDFSTLFQQGLDELRNRDISSVATESIVRTEGIACIERLTYELFTGDHSRRPLRLFRCLGTLPALDLNGWPFFKAEVFNLHNLSLSYYHWPMDDECHPYFAHTAALKYHYGNAVASNQHQLFAQLIVPHRGITVARTANVRLTHILKGIYIPELFNFLYNGFIILHQKLSRETTDSTESVITTSASAPLIGAISLWKDSANPLSFRLVIFFLILMTRSVAPVLLTLGTTIQLTHVDPDEYLDDLLAALTLSNGVDVADGKFKTSKMNWWCELHSLIHVFGYDEHSPLPLPAWKSYILSIMEHAQIEVVPGVWNKRPSYSNLIRIRYDRQSRHSAFRRSRAAILATPRHISPDCLGFVLPLTEIPAKLVQHVEDFFALRKPRHTTCLTEELRPTQLFVQRVFNSVDLRRHYDCLLIVNAMLLASRWPLPCLTPALPFKQWHDLTGPGKAGPTGQPMTFALHFVVTGMVRKYPSMSPIENEISWDRYYKRHGLVPY